MSTSTGRGVLRLEPAVRVGRGVQPRFARIGGALRCRVVAAFRWRILRASAAPERAAAPGACCPAWSDAGALDGVTDRRLIEIFAAIVPFERG